MTIDEAIGKLKLVDTLLIRCVQQPERDAIKLGIEALRECKKAREGDPAFDGELLPGETENK